MKFIEIGGQIINMDLVTMVPSYFNTSKTMVWIVGDTTGPSIILDLMAYEKIKKLFLNDDLTSQDICEKIDNMLDDKTAEFKKENEPLPDNYTRYQDGFLEGLEFAQRACNEVGC